MPLVVNLRQLEAHEVKLNGELPAAELDLGRQDPMIRVEKTLRYELAVQKLENNILVRGRLQLPLHCECVRCLKSFSVTLTLADWACHLALEGEEKAEIINDVVDLTPYVREDILLEFPQHPLCETECRGLPKKDSGRVATISDPGETKLSAWAALDKLKLKKTN